MKCCITVCNEKAGGPNLFKRLYQVRRPVWPCLCTMTQRVQRLVISPVLIVLVGLTGCDTVPMEQPPFVVSQESTAPKKMPASSEDATQVGRYSTIQNSATASQQDPLLAIAQFKFNASVKTVGQAVAQVLRDTGYALVPSNQLPSVVRELLSKPLPVTQRELGPISIGNALRTLMGEQVFTLVVDPVHRLVAFKLKSEFSPEEGVR